jgi:hypothetical protein
LDRGHIQGRIQDFKLGGAHLKKLRRAEGGAKNFGVFRVKNHDFTPKKIRFIPNAEGSAKILGDISCEKSRFYAKKIRFFPNAEGSAKIFGVFRVKNHDFTPKNQIFSNFRGGRAPGAPHPP